MGIAGVHTSAAVRRALEAGRSVVALETAVLTHGLPRDVDAGLDAEDLDVAIGSPGVPLHLRVMRAMVRAVQDAGAVPAVTGVLDGRLVIGLDHDEVDALADATDVVKISCTGLAPALASGATGGTTVSASLAACALAAPGPIRVLATGGIGGVHRGWCKHPDISADLAALARTPTAVVCSGAKSILDVPATAEALETLGVPIIGIGTFDLPLFHALGDGRARLASRADSPAEAAEICRIRWGALGQFGGVILARPVPEAHAIPIAALEADLDAIAPADELGAGRTPALLQALAERTRGAALRANVALLLSNASWAARLASELVADPRSPGA